MLIFLFYFSLLLPHTHAVLILLLSNVPLVSLSSDTPCHPLLLPSARCFVGTLWLPTQQGLCSQLPVEDCWEALFLCVSLISPSLSVSPSINFSL